MLQFYLTEYEKDGSVVDGPLICAKDFDEAHIQARDLKLKLVGELFPLADLLNQETLH
tara:strand:- start:1881 stop:2054 length:174 start_codon:yes stop_codon:yes gene_type:complete